MARYKRETSIWSKHRISRQGAGMPDVDELKNRVCNGLMALPAAEREAFIQALETEMRQVYLSLRAYLIPLGILAQQADEMTPIEAAHVIRFLKINVPQAVPAIEKAMARFSVFEEQKATSGDWLAA